MIPHLGHRLGELPFIFGHTVQMRTVSHAASDKDAYEDTPECPKSFPDATPDFPSTNCQRENREEQPNCTRSQAGNLHIMYILSSRGLRCQAEGTGTFAHPKPT
jgi:hypothetical protein